jgi:hypothetical protein
LRAESYSTDGNVVISLQTKYSTNEWRYSIPIERFRDLVIDLKRLNCCAAYSTGQAHRTAANITS